MYHVADSINILHRTEIAFFLAFIINHPKTADETSDEDDRSQSENGIYSANFEPNRVGHQHCDCLADADEDIVFCVLVAQLRDDQV